MKIRHAFASLALMAASVSAMASTPAYDTPLSLSQPGDTISFTGAPAGAGLAYYDSDSFDVVASEVWDLFVQADSSQAIDSAFLYRGNSLVGTFSQVAGYPNVFQLGNVTLTAGNYFVTVIGQPGASVDVTGLVKVTAVPEPESVGLALAGLAVAGLALKRRARAAA